MELTRAVEHHGCSEEEHSPLRATSVSGPHGTHEKHSSLVMAWDECHVNDADDKCRDSNDYS